MEKTFYEDPEICVTDCRVIVHGKTYPLPDIIAVEHFSDEPSLVGWPLLLMVAAAVGALISFARLAPAWAFGCVVSGLFGAIFYILRATSHTISLVTTREAKPIIQSQNGEFVNAVLRALADALMASRLADAETCLPNSKGDGPAE